MCSFRGGVKIWALGGKDLGAIGVKIWARPRAKWGKNLGAGWGKDLGVALIFN